MDNFYSKVTRTCIKETWKMITTTQIEDLLERNWNITSLVRNHISFMNPPRRNISSFRTNGMQAYIIQYTILMMIQWYIFVYIIYTFYPLLSPPPCSWLSPHNGQEEWLVTTSGWQPLSWILPNFSLTLSSYLTQHLLTWLLQLTIKIYCKDWSTTFNTAILSWIWWK